MGGDLEGGTPLRKTSGDFLGTSTAGAGLFFVTGGDTSCNRHHVVEFAFHCGKMIL